MFKIIPFIITVLKDAVPLVRPVINLFRSKEDRQKLADAAADTTTPALKPEYSVNPVVRMVGSTVTTLIMVAAAAAIMKYMGVSIEDLKQLFGIFGGV